MLGLEYNLLNINWGVTSHLRIYLEKNGSKKLNRGIYIKLHLPNILCLGEAKYLEIQLYLILMVAILGSKLTAKIPEMEKFDNTPS